MNNLLREIHKTLKWVSLILRLPQTATPTLPKSHSQHLIHAATPRCNKFHTLRPVHTVTPASRIVLSEQKLPLLVPYCPYLSRDQDAFRSTSDGLCGIRLDPALQQVLSNEHFVLLVEYTALQDGHVGNIHQWSLPE